MRDLQIDGQAVHVVGVEATGFEDLDFVVFEFEGGGTAVILSPWAPRLEGVRQSRLVERAHCVVDYRALIEEGDVWEAPSRTEAARLAAKYCNAARERGGSPVEPSKVGDPRKRRELEVMMAFMHLHPDRTFGSFWAWRHYEVGIEVPMGGEG